MSVSSPLDAPVAGHTYRVGVHFYSDHGAGPTSVTVKIYCGDITVTPVTTQVRLLTGPSSSNSNEFWRVADVVWQGTGTCNFTLLNRVTTAATARTSP